MSKGLGAAAAAGLAAAMSFFVWRRLRSWTDEDHALEQIFDKGVDRRGVHTVKHGLAKLIHDGAPADALPMWVADMDFPCSSQIRDAIRERAEHATFGYTYQPGEIWTGVAAWLEQHHGWVEAPSSFVFSASIVTSFANILRACTEPGDGVLVMTPLFRPLQDAVRGTGRRLVEYHLAWNGASKEYEFDLEAVVQQLRKGDCRALLLCNPHNPSGRVWSHEELTGLAEVCHRSGTLLVSDEIWADWVFSPRRHVPIMAAAKPVNPRLENIIALGSPTKSFNLAGLHCSYLAIPSKELRERYLRYAEPAFLHYGSTFATVALLAAYSHGEDWLATAKLYVEGNIALLERELEPVAAGIQLIRPPSTYLVLLDCSGLGMSAEELSRFMLTRARLILSPGTEFGETGVSTQFMRINLAASRATVLEAARRLVEAARPLLQAKHLHENGDTPPP